MSMQDPIADMLTRIRNGQLANKKIVLVPSSKMKEAIASLLKVEGFIEDFRIAKSNKPILELKLKYYQDKPVIEVIRRISRPGLRIYKKKNVLPRVRAGMGIAIISTSRGIVTDRVARLSGLGGEVICYIA
ncbi:30S ribosomal protein S8 [Sodalis sp. CWE]|uniref:30S ribosomal protein S8 n=1 Tax=Sodalis sp. CWE TaxID=2803816 RepID=UPI001C7DD8C1|nr:30S ribosomal protein S8 [Sodalis sp. CWE]MBX4180754.1 30S ribosomal protein S8 [Sodalis sp. CWE]